MVEDLRKEIERLNKVITDMQENSDKLDATTKARIAELEAENADLKQKLQKEHDEHTEERNQHAKTREEKFAAEEKIKALEKEL